MVDIVFTKDGATKTLPESFQKQMEGDGWKSEGKIPEKKKDKLEPVEPIKKEVKAPDLQKQLDEANKKTGNKVATSGK